LGCGRTEHEPLITSLRQEGIKLYVGMSEEEATQYIDKKDVFFFGSLPEYLKEELGIKTEA